MNTISKFERFGFVFLLASVLAGTPTGAMGSKAPSTIPEVPISRFQKVSEGIYRGGRPDLSGIIAMRKFGIRTILNLDNSDEKVDQEQVYAESTGFKYLSFPMSAIRTPSDELIYSILDSLKDPTLRPIYIHCKLGKDRTGLMVGLHRVLTEGVDAKVAYREMREIGFNPIYRPLVKTFRRYTNFSSASNSEILATLAD